MLVFSKIQALPSLAARDGLESQESFGVDPEAAYRPDLWPWLSVLWILTAA